ncbi:MAG: glycosyltransferase family 2 protein [Gemmatimonadaceae bacterium]
MRPSIWQRTEAPVVRRRDRIALALLTGAGIAATLRLADWWFRAEHVSNAALFAMLSLAFWYAMSRVILGWVNYLGITRAPHVPAPDEFTVAIFTTSSPGEPLAMFERTLAACAEVSYPHTTYLLDDTRDPRYREAAERFGAVWLELVDIPGAKAGKINRALEKTTEEFILVLDPDHIPFPDLLHRVLGQFSDPGVGFVQVAQAYYNQPRSFTAAGAADQTYAFYGPGQMGLHGHGACLAIGANCTFRRAALESIAGHGIGLAEDLVTAIRIHAKGWRSVYLPEVVSRGLVPEDLGSYYRQQLKWARGVYEVAFVELPHALRPLTGRQRLAYLAVGTYYLFGPTTFLFLLFPYIYLWTGIQPASMRFGEFLTIAGPVGVIGAAIYLFAQRWLSGGAAERGLHWRGLVLKIACWPVYVAGTLLALVRAEIPYVPTEKRAVRGRFLRLAWPQLLLIAVYIATLVRIANVRIFDTSEGVLELTSEATWGMVAFATIPVLMSLGVLFAAWQSSRAPRRDDPWDSIEMPRGAPQ